MTSFYWNHPQIKEFFDYLRLKNVSEGTIKTYTRLSDPIAKEIALSIPTAADSLEAGEKTAGARNNQRKYGEELNYCAEFISNVLE